MTTEHARSRVVCFATQGSETLDGQRIRVLLSEFDPDVLEFDRGAKLHSLFAIRSEIRKRRPDLVVMEGTGVGGGLALISLPRRLGIRYVVSSGDAVGPFLAKHNRVLGFAGGLYERLLIRRCAGFIGWTPYLVGRALTFGAPRATSAPGWSRTTATDGSRARWRERFGIAADAIVFGLAGSLSWTQSVGYAYGLELIRALRRTTRADLCVCIVGDGSGLEHLVQAAGDELGRRVMLPGRISPDDVSDALSSFDVGSLPQSVDGVGNFRYSSKLPEYLSAGLPVVTGQIPLAYDLDQGWLWRLPGDAPWDDIYVEALAKLMEGITVADVAARAGAARAAASLFGRVEQQERVSAFIRDLLQRAPG